jgi:predicted Kef-type K+ transport protein
VEILWITVAFALGLLMRPLGLPPLVGYLVAGFLLNGLGLGDAESLEHIAHLGVLLLLFSVGLKLRLRAFASWQNLGGGVAHIAASMLIVTPLLLWLFAGGRTQAAIVALLLTFSSTVVAAKMLEERRELRSFHGRVTIGILVLQDIIAVALMAVTAESSPSWWSLALLALPLLRPALGWLLNVSGHDELLVLCGLLFAAAGGYGFASVGLSPELGALLLGALLSEHRKSKELADALWSLKEMLLVGFFLQIGMSGLPTQQVFADALLLFLLLPVKALLFFFVMVAVGLRARSAFLVGLSLASYSEFALIAAESLARHQWIGAQWLLPLAIAVALSFAVMAPLNRHAHELFERLETVLERFERARRHPDDEPISLGQAHVLVIGMGRIGTGAYDFLSGRNERVVGLDSDPGKVERHIAEHRRVLYADAEDPALWSRLRMDDIRAVLLILSDIHATQIAVRQLRRRGYTGLISAASLHPEEVAAIRSAGADLTFNVYDEAGVGFAEHVWEHLYNDGPRTATD